MSALTQPPNSDEAERALIASMLISPDQFSTIDIEARDFYQLKHQQIWQAMAELQNFDYITLIERLKSKKQLDKIGGSVYLTSLLTGQVSSLNAQEYAAVIRDMARRRGLIQLAGQITAGAFDMSKPIEVLTPEYINALVDASRMAAGAEHISGTMSKLFDQIEQRSKAPRDVWGLEVGFPMFDKITGGFQQKELAILSGEPGVGKSILGTQMALQMAASSPGVIYSMEMGELQLGRRMISGEARVATRAIKSGKLEGDDWQKIVQAIEKINALNLYMSDSSGWTTTSMRADLARLKAQHGITWFVLDYLYLLNDGAGEDEIERTALVSKGLKAICKDLDLAGLVIHSMNKTGIGSKTLDNNVLRGSGQVIYDADLIIYLTKFKPYTEQDKTIPERQRDNLRTVIFGKGRELEDDRKFVHLVKQQTYPVFAEMARDPSPVLGGKKINPNIEMRTPYRNGEG